MDYKDKILYLDEVKSTSDICKDLIRSKSDKKIVIAKSQSQGRGQRDNRFKSPEGGLYISFIIRQNFPRDFAKFITGRMALGLVWALEDSLSIDSKIKWINDIVYNNKKLAGILTEGQIISNRLTNVIVGIGLNLGDPPPLDHTTGLGLDYDKARPLILDQLIYNIYGKCLDMSHDDFISSYNSNLFKLGEVVTFTKEGKEYKGILQGVDSNLNIIISDKAYEYGQISLDLYD